MTKPLVSICIPVYNGEATIEACLKAVLAQDVENAEILIVDNQSTDRTVEIVEQMIHGVPNARLIRNKTNIGRIENWNRCLEIAQGRYLKFALANDALLKGSVRCLLEEALKDKEIALVCSWHTWVLSIPEIIPDMEPPIYKKCLSSIETLILINERGNPFWALNGMLINLQPVRENGLRFRVDMPQLADVYFATQLVAHGKTLFVESASYLFNRGAKNRFHLANIDLTQSFYQLRLCLEEATILLQSKGKIIHPKINERMYDSLKYYLYEENVHVTFNQALALFAGHGLWQARAGFEMILYLISIRNNLSKLRKFMRIFAF
ncbi:MAG: glycosyltransferase family 2 protein [Acidobacteriota bacterium]|nr:MAG: glycosyltransferase family 2 protein [Acidobacteriota bacterium]